MGTQFGAAWYRRDQWERLRQAAADPEVLEETWEEWLAVAERGMRMAAKAGGHIEQVDVDVRKLIAWCIQENRPLDGPARAEFVAHLMRERDQLDQPGSLRHLQGGRSRPPRPEDP